MFLNLFDFLKSFNFLMVYIFFICINFITYKILRVMLCFAVQ